MEKALQIAKDHMEVSNDLAHNSHHAQEVEKHALEIAKEFGYTDLALISVVAWWHDVYKAGKGHLNLIDAYTEGERCAQMARNELEGVLEEEKLAELVFAVRKHDSYFWQLLNRGKMPVLAQILIEADGIDRLRKSRDKRILKNQKNLLYRLNRTFWYMFSDYVLESIVSSEYGKEKLGEYRNG